MKEVQASLLVLGLTGFSFSLLLAFLSKKLKVKEDARIEKILSILPGLNCGACGVSGCRVFAQAVVKEGKIFSGCLPAGEGMNKEIAKALGIETSVVKRKSVAVCRCGADDKEKKVSCLYQGPKTCKAADLIGGAIDCLYGCFGFGDCEAVCPPGAITVAKGKVYVDIEKCIGCGKCLPACPSNLFELLPLAENLDTYYYIACNNREKGVNVKKVCSRGCIACGICTKGENSPFYLKDNLAFIEYKKIVENEPLEEAKNKCPTKCIMKFTVHSS
ncbi:MAG: 4Fe-4S dicluster domain-containing protein [Candidatus Omnitrophica bacterium]|nr:4Fe-4S dicluster domain-containing protein [Candidatus Omnitrophota bacterium]MBU0879033.1 4Fe-4S dicluster domain-containing protein [Candidatus Omnitrophota bacterium]MBU0896814.1 4Fe-4S dicluster domain-containing protein [Candidatus Omnitrophota bacterium]MBU1134249.1 4Fe-4S dicluster domain-containing protein [Candidatus Omnitrophota bacterium]MBU1810424.1 4Fe-4S dicluster domain-containing protein [Candidatus Omnitrophota bacterium]